MTALTTNVAPELAREERFRTALFSTKGELACSIAAGSLLLAGFLLSLMFAPEPGPRIAFVFYYVALAIGLIHAWLRFPVQDTTLAIMKDALEIKATARLSYWDAAIVAAAHALGCSELLSEDMSHGRKISGVTIVNPFR